MTPPYFRSKDSIDDTFRSKYLIDDTFRSKYLIDGTFRSKFLIDCKIRSIFSIDSIYFDENLHVIFCQVCLVSFATHMAHPLLKLNCSVLLVMYSWLKGFRLKGF